MRQEPAVSVDRRMTSPVDQRLAVVDHDASVRPSPREGQDVGSHLAHGHRRGVAYEALVYRRILATTRAATPALYGSHYSDRGETWLFVEHLDAAHTTWTPAVSDSLRRDYPSVDS